MHFNSICINSEAIQIRKKLVDTEVSLGYTELTSKEDRGCDMSLTNDILFSYRKIQESTELLPVQANTGNLTLSQVHCISVIGNIEDANVSRIAKELEMTTGAITKMCKKIFQQGYVEKHQEPGNQQKIYYRLTTEGQRIYQVHQGMHKKVYQDRRSILDHYSEEEKHTILTFLNEMHALTTRDITLSKLKTKI